VTALVINAGPVNGPGISKRPGDIGQVDWAEKPDILTISGNGSSYFSSLASQWTVNGHILPQLLAHYGRSASSYSSISLTGFSAGHGLFGPLLLLDGDDIAAAVLFDSCFTGKGPPDHPSNGKDGYAAFGARAIRGEKLLVLTASRGENGPGLPPTATGSQCALASFQRALDLAGATDTPFDVPAGIPTTNPKGNFYGPGQLETHRAGLFFVFDYGPLYYHGDHINLLSRDILSAYLAPYLSGLTPGGPTSPPLPGTVDPQDPGAPADGASSSSATPLLIGALAMGAAAIYIASKR
jgi:hypothetical protein